MTAATALKAAAIAEIPLVLLGMGLTWNLPDSMPPELAEYSEKQFTWLISGNLSAWVKGAVLGYALVMSVCYIGGLIGLVRLRTWGALFYLCAVLLSMPGYFLFGYEILHPAEQIHIYVLTLVSGAILGLAFFSDALPWKNNHRVEAVDQP